jgi:hypothetical protein
VDLELADRLHAEGMAQLVEAEPRQTSPLARTDEAPGEVGIDDQLIRPRAALEDQLLIILALTQRPENPTGV